MCLYGCTVADKLPGLILILITNLININTTLLFTLGLADISWNIGNSLITAITVCEILLFLFEIYSRVNSDILQSVEGKSGFWTTSNKQYRFNSIIVQSAMCMLRYSRIGLLIISAIHYRLKTVIGIESIIV